MQTEIAQQGMDIGNIMDIVVHRAQIITDAEGASMELVENNELVYRATSGVLEKFLGLRLYVENSLSGECIKMRVPLISHDIESDERVNKSACREMGIRSMIVIPLIYNTEVVGILKVISNKVEHFMNKDVDILQLMSGLIAAEMSQAIKNGESELVYRATHDSLTGIANRSLFYDRLRQKVSSGLKKDEQFGIISLDIDKLKEINDQHGHRAGDAAIKEVASRIKNVISNLDTVSRLGGDEFGIILATVEKRKDIILFIDQISDEIIKPFEFENSVIDLRISIGYAYFKEDGIELEALIEKADHSMYEMKKKRKGADNVR